MNRNTVNGNKVDEKVRLVKQVNVFDCVALVTGIIIGSGIFLSPKGILENTGTVGWALMVWVLCGIFTFVGALCYAELGTSIDKSGGDYTYLRILQPILGFLRVWTMILAVSTVPWTVLAITAARNITASLIDADCDVDKKAATQILAACILACIIFVNCWSVKLSRMLQIIFTIAKFLGLIIIIVGGMWALSQGHTDSFQNAFDSSEVKWVQFPKAFYSGLFAYSGWQFLPQVTEEIVNPGRNIPLSITLSVAIVMVIFMLTNVAYFAVMSPFELLASDAVALTFGQRVLGGWWWIMPVAVTCSCIGSINGGIFGTARTFFVASREGQLPDILGMIHVNRRTPLPAAAFALPICFMMLISDDVFAMINYLSFSRWLFIATTVATVPYFRWKYPDIERPFKVPLILPILFTLCAVVLVMTSIISATLEFVVGLAITLAGIPVYLVCVWWEDKPKGITTATKSVTNFLQKFFFVVPQEVKTYESLL
ncbi:Y+L amino acid transporter 2-like [Apostichopus japonicus]|uniref:Y+L amino acid transporter 2-like n=1 Tax=Stichopus japonicus TaxID=307972 RepID=UPI003AB47BCC